MADAAADPVQKVEKSSKLPLILGLTAAVLGAVGGFFATFHGLILPTESVQQTEADFVEPNALPDITFVSVEPIVASLSNAAQGRHLRFRAKLEVPSKYKTDVETVLPRVVDVLNGYLRALELHDIESPSSLTRIRAQMLRRIQIVAGPGRVNDLLIMEFVLN